MTVVVTMKLQWINSVMAMHLTNLLHPDGEGALPSIVSVAVQVGVEQYQEHVSLEVVETAFRQHELVFGCLSLLHLHNINHQQENDVWSVCAFKSVKCSKFTPAGHIPSVHNISLTVSIDKSGSQR